MIKSYLASRGITQKQFASELHISRSYMSLLANRRRTSSPKLARKIERITNKQVTIMWLLFGESATANKEQQTNVI